MRSKLYAAPRRTCALACALAFGAMAATARADLMLTDDFDAGVVNFSVTGPVSGSSLPVQIRPTTDSINTATASGFDGFFGSSGQFLVIGDYNGAIGNGTPAGPVGNASSQVSTARFGLGTFPAGAHRLGIGFDFAFDTSLAPGTTLIRNPDDFVVSLTDGNGLLLELLRFDDVLRNESTRRGTWSGDATFSLASAQPLTLVFSLTEYANNGDSAVGIDNLSVVPAASPLALAGLALAALACLRRRREPRG
jgi:hypothetical protein